MTWKDACLGQTIAWTSSLSQLEVLSVDWKTLMPIEIQRCGATKQQKSRSASHALRLVFGSVLVMSWSGAVAAEDFLQTYIREQGKGYHARACGFDMDRNGVVGEEADSKVGNGRTADPDGDGVSEDLTYVDAEEGSDERGNGTASAPYRTIGKATCTKLHGRDQKAVGSAYRL